MRRNGCDRGIQRLNQRVPHGYEVEQRIPRADDDDLRIGRAGANLLEDRAKVDLELRNSGRGARQNAALIPTARSVQLAQVTAEQVQRDRAYLSAMGIKKGRC